MMIDDFVLASGRVVRLDALHIDCTYADLVDGIPDAKYNEKILARKRQHLEKVWGQRPTHLISPETRTVEVKSLFAERGIYLPEITYHAWLTSDPIGGESCGSELVVVWFEHKAAGTGVLGVVERAVRDLPWEQLAKDYDV